MDGNFAKLLITIATLNKENQSLKKEIDYYKRKEKYNAKKQ